MESLSILLTNIAIAGLSGTEINVRDLALGLQTRGHRPIVYSPHIGSANELGPVARELRGATIPVVDDISQIAIVPNIIHGNHNSPTVTAIARFPQVPALFWCHDWLAWHDTPPLLPSIRCYVAVDDTNRDRFVVESGIPADKVRVVYNAVNLNRFEKRGTLPPRPGRALVFTRHGGHLQAVRAACAQAGIELDEAVSDVTAATRHPERLLPNYDLVFAAARCALEALAVGAAVIVCDGRGLAGLVTSENVEHWRRLNFGIRALSRPVTPSELVHEISKYNALDAATVAKHVRTAASSERQLDDFEKIYSDMLEEHSRIGPPEPEEVAQALSCHLQKWLPGHDGRWPLKNERETLLRKLEETQEEIRTLLSMPKTELILRRLLGLGKRIASKLWRLTGRNRSHQVGE